MAVQESANKLFAIGYTSGADALEGSIGTLMCCAAERRT